MSSNKIVTFNYGELRRIIRWIAVPLHGEEARKRNRLVQVIQPLTDKAESHRMELVKKYADKDEKGEPIIENKVFKMTDEARDKATKEMDEYLLDNVLEFEVNAANTPLLIALRDILKKSQVPLSIEDGAIYDDVLSELEEV